jgi:hypothetical protein
LDGVLAPFLHEHGVYYVALQGKGGSAAAEDEAEKLNSLFRNRASPLSAPPRRHAPLPSDAHRGPRG